MFFLWTLLIGLYFRYANGGYCTQSYTCTEKCIRTEQYHSKCGMFSWSTCTRYRLVVYSCYKSCYRQVCCPGYYGRNCESSTLLTPSKQETITGKPTATIYTTELFFDNRTGSMTVDQGQTSISNVSTAHTSLDTHINSTLTMKSNATTQTEDTVLESTTTTTYGINANISSANNTFTTKVYEFNSSDYLLELEIIVLVCGCTCFVLIVYMSVVCVYTIRRTKHNDRIFILRLLVSCLCICCTSSYYYMSRKRSEIKRTSRQKIRSDKTQRQSQLTTNRTFVWQEEQRNISKSVKADPSNIKRTDYREEPSLHIRELVVHEEEKPAEVVKERILPEEDFQICVVQPLKGADRKLNNTNTSIIPFQNKRVEDNDWSLDWHAIFMFLMKLVQPGEWKLFGTQLLGNQHDVDVIATEAGNNINSCIYNLFKKWHVTKGRDTNHADIEDAMAKLEWNLQLDEFRSFMKSPPLVQSQNVQQQIAEQTAYIPTTNLYRPRTFIRSGKNLSVFAAREFEHESLENVQILQGDTTQNILSHTLCTGRSGYQQVTESAYASEGTPFMIQVNTGNSQCRKKCKRKLQCAEDAFAPVQKRRKKWKRSSLRRKNIPASRKLNKRNEKSSICNKLASWDTISKKCIINLIRIVLPLENHILHEKEYNIFLDFTVSLIIEQTGKPEYTILTIMLADYEDAQKVSTKYRENYVIDSHKTSLLLDRESWEHLELYKVHAREKVLHFNGRDTCSKHGSLYLFISYQGQPLMDQVNNLEHKNKDEIESLDYVKTSSIDNTEGSGRHSMVGESSWANESVEQVGTNDYPDNETKNDEETESTKVTPLTEDDATSSALGMVKVKSKCKSTSNWEVFV